MNESTPARERAPINWVVTLTLGLTFLAAITIVPWYGIVHGYSTAAWVIFGVFMLATGIGIGSGYHRLWSHRAYEAHPALQWFLAIAGGTAIQNSVIVWCSRHRPHHRYVDSNEKDPYSIGRGFWFAHVGWMLKDYESGEIDLSTVRDLQENPILVWQDRYYIPLILTTNIALPMLLGWMVGDFWGVFLLAGVLRLVVNHHFTFFINSLAHMWGSRPYTDENTARDNWFLAIITYGEGYHNYHHLFQNDYRNGIRWYNIDLNKWFIATCAGLGLARNLKRAPQFKIQRARLAMEFKRAHEHMEANETSQTWRDTLEKEYAQFMETVKRWQALQLERVEMGKKQLVDRWERTSLKQRYRELEKSLRMQRRRMVALNAALKL